MYVRKSMGFNDVIKMLGISSKVLLDKLRVLEEAKIVNMIVQQESRVRYELTFC